MVHRHVMGKEGLTLAVIASMAMTAVAFFVGSHGTFWSWAANTALLGVTAVMLSIVNKEFRIVNGSDTILIGMFLVLSSSNVWTSGLFTSSGFMALVNLICIYILFGCYRQRNATREIFIIGTILSIGSIFEYAFIFMMPLYILGALMVKCLSVKAVIAFIMGILAPYWIAVGFGLLPPESLKFPELSNVFGVFASKSDMFVGLLNVGITLLITLMLALTNSVRLYAGNSKRRIFNMVINVMGIATLICMIFDFDNLTTYLVTLYLVMAVQLGNLFELRNIHRGGWWLLSLSLLYAAGFVMMIIR